MKEMADVMEETGLHGAVGVLICGEPRMGEEVMERAVMVEAGGRWERWKMMYVMVKGHTVQLFLPDLSVSSQEPEYLDFGALILRLVSGL